MAGTAILANPSTGLEIFRVRLDTRLYLFAVGEIDDLPTAMDELLVDVFHYATAENDELRETIDELLVERAGAIVDELALAWRQGGDRALKQSRNAERLRRLSSDQLDQLEKRIQAMKGSGRGNLVDR